MENKIVEINGVKLELDMRSATMKRVDTFKVGDSVKLLRKQYSGHEVKYAVIVGFDDFQKQPSINVAYLDYSELKFERIVNGGENEIIATDDHDLIAEKDWIVERMRDAVVKKELELQETKMKLNMFLKFFGKYLEPKEEKKESV